MPTQLNHAGPFFFSYFLGNILFALLFILLVAGWFLLKRFPNWLRSIRGAGWPLVEAKVETVNVSTFAEQALGEVGYCYSVEGTRYSGYFSRQFADEQDAWDYVGPLKGQPIFVRYKPNSPDVSVLHSAEQNARFVAGPGGFVRRLLSLLAELVFGELEAQKSGGVRQP